jgi:hypothetical protein
MQSSSSRARSSFGVRLGPRERPHVADLDGGRDSSFAAVLVVTSVSA